MYKLLLLHTTSLGPPCWKYTIVYKDNTSLGPVYKLLIYSYTVYTTSLGPPGSILPPDTVQVTSVTLLRNNKEGNMQWCTKTTTFTLLCARGTSIKIKSTRKQLCAEEVKRPFSKRVNILPIKRCYCCKSHYACQCSSFPFVRNLFLFFRVFWIPNCF